MTPNKGPEVTMPEFSVISEPVSFTLQKNKFRAGGSQRPRVDGAGRRGGGGLIIKKEQIGASGAPGSILIDSERGVSTF